jgi:phosphoribosylaminoimidazole carboxylase (NCAIR synthetase)
MQALIAIELMITGVIAVIVFGVSQLAQELARRPHRPAPDEDDEG